VPDRDDVKSHISNKRAQGQDIVRPSYYTQSVKVSTWPVRILLSILTLAVIGGGYGAYYFYGEYQTDLRQANLRIGDLEARLALVGESAEESDNSLMEDINKTIEQYDLLWANWRNNNRTFEEIQGEIARLKLANEGQDESVVANAQQIAASNETLTTAQARLNSLSNELQQVNESIAALDDSMARFEGMRSDLESVRVSLNSGDSTLLGLAGRIEYMEQSMESVNAHRLQINESLFRLQENVETIQRSLNSPGGT
jgi:septal ring factor EnvC (AmiA/AmiB activator)